MTFDNGLRISSVERDNKVEKVITDIEDIVLIIGVFGGIAFFTWYAILVGAGLA